MIFAPENIIYKVPMIYEISYTFIKNIYRIMIHQNKIVDASECTKYKIDGLCCGVFIKNHMYDENLAKYEARKKQRYRC